MRLHPAVALLLLALVAPARADGDPLRDAMTAAASAAQAKDWAGAETAYREAARLVAELAQKQPDNLDLAFTRDGLEYNAACSASLAGRTDAAFALLRGLLARSWYDNDDLLANDADLAALRTDPRFAEIVAGERKIMEAATEGHAEGVILQPRKRDDTPARVPLIVALHGGGGNVESWQDEWRRVADRLGVVVVLVRGTRVQGVGAFSYDQARPAHDVARIEAFIARAKAQVPAIDESDAFLAGFSQGGGMAWVLGVTGERAWRGIIPIGGYVQVAAREKVTGEPKHELAAYAFVGERDEEAIRKINATLCSQQGLQRLRAKLEVMKGQAHVLPPGFPAAIARAMRWCRKGRP